MTNEQDLPNEDELEVVSVCDDPSEAKMIEEMLQNNGIDCVLQGDVNAVLPAGDLDDIQILVKPEDFLKAEELVDAFFSPMDKDEMDEEDEGEDEDKELGV